MTKKKSKIIIWVLVLIIIALGWALFNKKSQAPTVEDVPKEEVKATPITISEQDIKEANFTGSMSVIKGSGLLADAGRAYIEETISSFKQSADEEVPNMRESFGADSPTSNYEIILKATYVKVEKTESIIIDEYVYTGGANGNSAYKVFTVSLSTGKILTLADVIQPSKQGAFTSYVKDKLMTWKPEGSEGIAVFPEEVKGMTFSSFSDWSFGKNNLILYFDKFEIGPGVLGAVAFPLPFSKSREFFVAGY